MNVKDFFDNIILEEEGDKLFRFNGILYSWQNGRKN